MDWQLRAVCVFLIQVLCSGQAGRQYKYQQTSKRLRKRLDEWWKPATVVAVKPGEQWGRWDGWGVSLCWWANVFGNRDDIAEAVFTTKRSVKLDIGTVPGLGLNIARYNAGGSAWRHFEGKSMQESSNIPRWKQIEGFWQDWASDDPHSRSWNWKVDAKQVAMLRKASKLGANLFELFSNSPMWWMLSDANPSGATNGSRDNLKVSSYRQHAHYLATVAAHAEQYWGISFASVEPFNEPVSPWWTSDNGQEGCHFDVSTQAAVVQALSMELHQASLPAIVAASDENCYTDALATWRSFHPSTRNALGRVNVHGYEALDGPREEFYKEVHPKGLWNTEYGDDDESGLTMAAVINLDLQHLHNSAWCYWQIADESDGWGLLKFDSSRSTLQKVNPKYFVLAQYTRHIRPGMQILGSSDPNTVAAYDEDGQVLVLVTMNHGPNRSFTYDLSGFSHVSGNILQWQTSVNQNQSSWYKERSGLQLLRKQFTVEFAANTVQTFEIYNASLQLGVFV